MCVDAPAASTKVVAEPALPAPARSQQPHLHVKGKFLFEGDEKFFIKGVTYGTFSPNEEGMLYPEPSTVARDFAMMQQRGINTVRTYTPPPRWLLDLALAHGLRIMVGLPWEQHHAFLEDEERAADVERRVREQVAGSAGHPAVLCYAVGNEIPAPIVRWHGRRRVERFLHRLYRAVKEEAPEALATYVNYPTTEYLELPFVDFVTFNVYLESQDDLEAYLAKLQTLAGERPLVMAEVGLDSQRNGLDEQARVLTWQVQSTFGAGCAGIFVFAWTDAWYRGGNEITDWDFGLVTRDRSPKPALKAVSRAFARAPLDPDTNWPKVSVVVCSYNGAETLRGTLEGIERLAYPNVEAIVVDDGSTDDTAAIARAYAARLIRTENRGLGSARNTGLYAATGKIVAYIDDDAYPDPHWLHYLAHSYQTSDFVGMGGPNLLPAEDGPVAECVANAPGGPTHVLLSDREAEHIPGCNMSFRREALLAVGGFDPRYRAAGDDVDICWRVREEVGSLGFSPAAVVWHHRRSSLRCYWRQQQGYGKAEALLAEKWPERYNGMGHLDWSGRIYGRGLTKALRFAPARVYHGVWGSAPFQSLYREAPTTLASMALMPEWYVLISVLVLLSALGAAWTPLLLALPLLLGAIALPAAQAVKSAANASFESLSLTSGRRAALRLRGLTTLLHLAQPAARLYGRLRHNLTPWRRYGRARAAPKKQEVSVWREDWRAPTAWLEAVETLLGSEGVPVRRGYVFDRWDVEVRGGALGTARLLMTIEEHGSGKQFARFRLTPRVSPWTVGLLALFSVLALWAFSGEAWAAGSGLLALALLVALTAYWSCAAAVGATLHAIDALATTDVLDQERT